MTFYLGFDIYHFHIVHHILDWLILHKYLLRKINKEIRIKKLAIKLDIIQVGRLMSNFIPCIGIKIRVEVRCRQ